MIYFMYNIKYIIIYIYIENIQKRIKPRETL